MLNISSSELLVSTIPDNCVSTTFQELTVRDLSLYDFQVDNNQDRLLDVHHLLVGQVASRQFAHYQLSIQNFYLAAIASGLK